MAARNGTEACLIFTWRTTAEVTSEKLRSGYGMSQQYISHRQIPKLYTSHFLL